MDITVPEREYDEDSDPGREGFLVQISFRHGVFRRFVETRDEIPGVANELFLQNTRCLVLDSMRPRIDEARYTSGFGTWSWPDFPARVIITAHVIRPGQREPETHDFKIYFRYVYNYTEDAA
jgi:hypothetical protein